MNRGAVAEMAAAGLDAVIVKGDLSNDGLPEEWAAFEACYRQAFGDRLHVVRGNHDGYRMQHEYAGDEWIELPGVAVALLDTVTPGETGGGMLPASSSTGSTRTSPPSDRPVIVMGHHQQSIGGQQRAAPTSGSTRPAATRSTPSRPVGRPSSPTPPGTPIATACGR